MAEEAPTTRAKELIRDAEKKLGSFSLFNKQAKFEDAAELYSKAAAQFKIAKQWEEAGQAYVKAAENSGKCGNEVEQLNCWVQAGKCLKYVDAGEAVKYFDIALAKQMENNKFSAAAKLAKEVAMMYEAEVRLPDAIKYYTKAADCYQAEDSTTSASQCFLKVADFCAQQEEYERAVELYEMVSRKSLDNNLTKWSVTQYLFKAGLCHMALGAKKNDMSDFVQKVSDYKDLHAQFESSRECQFLDALAATWDEKDLEKFTDAVYDFDQIQKLDNWKSGILLAIKNRMKAIADRTEDTAEEHEQFK